MPTIGSTSPGVKNRRANDNGAEGIDIDEADGGEFFVWLSNIESNDPLDVAD